MTWLELQPSLYDPPEDSPFTEHYVYGSQNALGTKVSGSYMNGVNSGTYAVVGEKLHSVMDGAMPCFTGVILLNDLLD